MVTERPILLAASEVRAILEGHKHVMRRVARPQPPQDSAKIVVGFFHPTKTDRRGEEHPGDTVFGAYTLDGDWGCVCPYGGPGTLLWVREPWADLRGGPGDTPAENPVVYQADGMMEIHTSVHRWRPSIHMPRRASRLALRVLAVRFERVQDITNTDAIAEGAVSRPNYYGYRNAEAGWSMDWSPGGRPNSAGYILTDRDIALASPRWAFANFWDRHYGKRGYGWATNPFCWVVEFEMVEKRRKFC